MTTPSWGYERPDCIGDNALALFIDDIQRVIDHYTQTQADIEVCVFQAQAAANKLLQAYEKNARKSTAFKGQYIQIKAVANTTEELQLVPLFSPGLKQALKKLLERSQATTRH